MPTILLITSDDSIDPRPDDAWTVERISPSSASEGADCDVVVVDFRDGEPTEDLIELTCGVPTVAILDDSAFPGRDVTDSLFARIHPSWLDSDASILRACVVRMHDIGRQAAELRTLRERQEHRLHAEKYAAVGLLAAEIAHEINNPSTFVITNLTVMMDYVRTIGRFHVAVRESLATDGTIDVETFARLEDEHEIAFLDEDLDLLLERSLAGLNRIHQIVQDLRYFSHERRTEWGWVDVAGIVHASVKLVRHEARFRAEVDVDLQDLPPVESDANRLSQVILNVLVNAVQAIPPGNPDENVVRVTASRDDDRLLLRISDTGPGMEPELLGQIFEPFFTTKEPGVGTGLGLSIASDIMDALGGEITASSEPGEGATFTVHIPVQGTGEFTGGEEAE